MHKWDVVERITQRLGGGIWKPYTYESDEIALDTTSNLTRQVTIQLVDGQPFIWLSGLYKSSVAAVMAGTDVLFGGVAIKFDELAGHGQGGKSWQTADAFFSRGGTSGEPRDLPYPLTFAGVGVIAFEVQNRAGAAQNARFSLIGVKRYAGA